MSHNFQEIRFHLSAGPRPPRARQNSRAHAAADPAPRQLPRITRLMALAIKLENLVCEHPDLTHRDLARLGHVSATRLTQVLNLLHLAPDLQERLLRLEPNPKGREHIHESALRRLSGLYDWRLQRLAFEAIVSDAGGCERHGGSGGPHA